MKSFIELAKSRFSCRKFKNTLVEKGLITLVLEAARVAPSAVNYQPWQFIVISDALLLDKIKSTYPREWFNAVNQIIVVLGDHSIGWKRKLDNKDHTDIDIAITIDHLTLAATDLGLGTCWVCNFDANRVAEFLNLPSTTEVIALIPIGYPDETPNPERHITSRLPMEAIVKWM